MPLESCINTLSGRGKQIYFEKNEEEIRVKWGKGKFRLSTNVIDDILYNFFIDVDNWYPLGADFANPMLGGLGEFIKTRYPNLTPRHASAIAAIMASLKMIEHKGKKPIILRKIQ